MYSCILTSVQYLTDAPYAHHHGIMVPVSYNKCMCQVNYCTRSLGLGTYVQYSESIFYRTIVGGKTEQYTGMGTYQYFFSVTCVFMPDLKDNMAVSNFISFCSTNHFHKHIYHCKFEDSLLFMWAVKQCSIRSYPHGTVREAQ